MRFYAGDVLRDRDFAHISDVLGDAGNATELTASLPGALKTQLARAAPIYRQSCWSNHHKANEAWIESLKPLLHAHGMNIASRLTKIYEAEWPAKPLLLTS